LVTDGRNVEKDALRIIAKRADSRYSSIEELWRRASVPVAALHGTAKADGYGSLGLSRRQSAWAIKALRDEALPLFAVADDRAAQLRPEITEPAVSLPVMTMGREVVEDYRSKGLSLRAHPVAFLRESLAQRGFAPCSALRDASNGWRISIAGLILVRQMPGSAKGVMFITLEDELVQAIKGQHEAARMLREMARRVDQLLRKFRPPDLIDFSMTPNRRLSAVRCQETEFRWC
jgi:error-prone DNA polymerase